MKEIVSRILREEEDVRELLKKAEAQAADFIARARKQGTAIIDNLAAEMKIVVDQNREQAAKKFQAEKEQNIAETRNAAFELREKRLRDIPQLAQRIFSQVTEIKV